MPDEFDHHPDKHFSSFWPLLILIIGLLAWSGYQVYATNNQRSLVEQREQQYEQQLQDKQFQAAIIQANTIGERYKALAQDLIQTSSKNSAAAQIVREMIQAGLIHVQPSGAGNAATPPEPAPSK